jgi:single-strand DNA-binding protein
MANSINAVILSGNLTRDAETKPIGTDRIVVSFGIAVNDRRKNRQTGEWEDVPNFIDVKQFMSTNQAQAFFHGYDKGARAVVHGKLHYSSWEKDGQKRSKVDVVADTVEIVSRAKQETEASYVPSAPAPGPVAAAPAPGSVFDADIPF